MKKKGQVWQYFKSIFKTMVVDGGSTKHVYKI